MRAHLIIAGLLACLGCQRREAAKETLTVFAAASLRDAFESVGPAFEAEHPGVEVQFSFAGTHLLRTQIEQGARVDVFASADLRNMEELVRSGRVTDPVFFARNEPVMVVSEATNLTTFQDLAKAERIVLGAPEVPIGRYAGEVLTLAERILGPEFRASVESHVVSRELNVRQVFAKVSLGEAQAAIVYRTDVPETNHAVRVIAIPAEMNVVADYPVAVATEARHPALARAWIDFILGSKGQAILQKAGFLSPGRSAKAP